ncbi:unnamed protein product, partial [Chrysoparadoxa australica]
KEEEGEQPSSKRMKCQSQSQVFDVDVNADEGQGQGQGSDVKANETGEDHEKQVDEGDVALLCSSGGNQLGLPEAEQPQGLTVSLRPYQKQAVGWMLERERKRWITESEVGVGACRSLLTGDDGDLEVIEVVPEADLVPNTAVIRNGVVHVANFVPREHNREQIEQIQGKDLGKE